MLRALTALALFGAMGVPAAPQRLEMRRGEVHRFLFALSAGEYLRLEVDQLGIDVTVRRFDAEGRLETEIDSPSGAWGKEVVSLLAESAGRYAVEVAGGSYLPTAPPGAYELRLVARRPREPGDRARLEAEALSAEGVQGVAQRDASSLRRGVEAYRRALELWRQLRDPLAEGAVLEGLARGLERLNLRAQAVAQTLLARDLYLRLADDGGSARAENSLCRLLVEVEGPREAAEHCRRAVELFARLEDRRGLASAWTNRGLAEMRTGRPDEAEEAFRQALEAVGTEAAGGLLAARITNALAGALEAQGRLGEASEAYLRALETLRALHRPWDEANTLQNRAVLLNRSGHWRQALAAYHESLGIFERLGDGRMMGRVRANRAAVWLNIGDQRRAREDLERALELLGASGSGSERGAALSLLGYVELAAERPQAASDLFGRAAALERSAAILLGLGRAERLLELAEASAAHLREALDLATASGDSRRRASALVELAEGDLVSGRLEQAGDRLAEALRLQEELHLPAGRSRSLFALARLGRLRGDGRQARSQVERALELLEVARREVSDPEDRALYLATQRQVYELGLALLAEEGEKAFWPSLALAERARARALFDRLQEPGEEGTAAGPTPSLDEAALAEELRRRVADGDTLVLAYWLGRERSYLWALSAADRRLVVLPAREAIERQAEEVVQAWSRDTDEREPEALAGLAQMLLGPVADMLRPHLWLLPDGKLRALPFAALPLPGEASTRLVDRAAVTYAPSLAILLELTSRPGLSEGHGKRVSVFGDPVFGREDPRLRPGPGEPTRGDQEPGRAAARGPELARAISRAGMSELPRLPASRLEALAIEEIFGTAEVETALAFEASRAALERLDLSRLQILHFATHAFLGDDPRASGLALSQVDAAGRPVDGFLRLEEIYGWKLEAELVMLSACRTALGEEIDGEGLIGLSRGFLAAGARAVASTLWAVSDRAMAELTRRFYHRLEAGLSPAEALRGAQLELRRVPRWRHAHDWAAVKIEGDGLRPLSGRP